MNEKYLVENELHFRIGHNIDKHYLKAMENSGEDPEVIIDRDAKVYFEAAVGDLYNKKENYKTRAEDKEFIMDRYDLFVFSKEDLEMFIYNENRAYVRRLIDQGDL